MTFNLRLLLDEDVPALQRVYDACPEAFRHRIGQPAGPDQAARDFLQALKVPGRYQFGITVDDSLVGLAEYKLDDEQEGLAHIGLLLLAPPYDEPEIARLALRILTRWLTASFGVYRLETSPPAHVPEAIAFWEAAGFVFTGGQYRRDLPNYHPRFLIMAKDLESND